MTQITLSEANILIAAALAEGRKRGLKPLCVAVLDPGGHVIALQRDDNASMLRPEIAIGKAAGALALGISSRKIAEMASERPTFVASLGGIAKSGLIPAAGGLIALRDGRPVGAVGVTGDTSDNDEACAIAGLEGAKLAFAP